MTAARERRLGRDLVAWYSSSARDLPWRRTTDPYAVWVSEIMLQQTTVAAVGPRYGPFLDRFPDVASLAAAAEDEVLRTVEGLGYYRRFRAMKRAAEALVAEFEGRLPETAAALRRLPGIGDYTAGAIASIAFNEPVAAVDGNVIRVISRLEASSDPVTTAAAKRRIGELVVAMMPVGTASRFNQALFDLGAGVCTPRAPRCDACPLTRDCRGLAAGDPETYPATPPRRAAVDVEVVAALLEHDGEILLTRRPPEASRMPGFWELPEAWGESAGDARSGLERILASRGVTARAGPVVATARHAITHHRLSCTLIGYAIEDRIEAADAAWVSSPLEPPSGAVSTITAKLWRALTKA